MMEFRATLALMALQDHRETTDHRESQALQARTDLMENQAGRATKETLALLACWDLQEERVHQERTDLTALMGTLGSEFQERQDCQESQA